MINAITAPAGTDNKLTSEKRDLKQDAASVKIEQAEKARVENVEQVIERKAEAERADNSKKEKAVDAEQLNRAIEKIESTAQYYNRKLQFEVEEELDITIVKVIDKETDEVVRQIPPETMVELAKHARDLKGLLLSEEG